MGKSSSYKKKLFQSYFIAKGGCLVGHPQYKSWREWITEQMKKMGRDVEETVSPDHSSVEKVIEELCELNGGIVSCKEYEIGVM